ncbi:Predicted amino acid dehydrogenase [Paraburkholderia terricola]|uniref:Predicted amino acid dehydrogenase n=2 Tax=Paraburkholderia terricola TaxID=169427 RepID=A0A1M6NWF1_9BURK|nr:Predicted amino acid dehydrogenase [Paraburkholderia sediminicola]SHK00013.1 Predicted amino acid dehydrogenase [Paraburkholderia terricola]
MPGRESSRTGTHECAALPSIVAAGNENGAPQTVDIRPISAHLRERDGLCRDPQPGGHGGRQRDTGAGMLANEQTDAQQRISLKLKERRSILTGAAALIFQREFNPRENQMRTSLYKEAPTDFAQRAGSDPHMSSAPLALKRVIRPEEIRENLPAGQGGVGFLFHATDWDTLSFSFHNVKHRNASFEEELWRTEPFIASPIYSASQVIGANIACPVPLELWLGSPRGIKRFRETQFFPALELAKQAGLNMVAMGASTPYACNYGALPRHTKPPHITTGHAATAAMLKDWAVHCCNELDLEFGKTKLALFGAAGRLGTTVAKYMLYKDAPKELVLIDLPDKANLLAEQARELLAADLLGKTRVSVHTFSPDTPLPQFDGAILASSTSVPYLTAADLKRAQFWIDDSHPRAASVEAELASRDHTLYIECFARGPAGLDTTFPFRLPTTRDCYTCFAEGYAAWQEGIASDFIIGSPPVWSVSYTHGLLKKYGFSVGPFHGKDGSPIVLDAQHRGKHELMGS